MMNAIGCTEFRKRLADLAAGSWEKPEEPLDTAMELHAASCAACRARLDAVRHVRTGNPDLQPPTDEAIERIVNAVAANTRSTSGDPSARRSRRARDPLVVHPALAFAAMIVLVVATAAITTAVNRAGGTRVATEQAALDRAATDQTTADMEAADMEAADGAATLAPGGDPSLRDGAATPRDGATTPAEASPSPGEVATVEVHLTLQAPGAASVAVAGDWNGWDTGVHRLEDTDGDGIWELNFRVKAGREYEYQFVVDGTQWVHDPQSLLRVEDGFGGTNSILDI